MPTAKDSELLIKQKLNELVSDQQKDLELFKYKLKDDANQLLESQRKILHELNIYRYVIRAIFAIFILLLGGSIYGIFKYQDYLDERIAARIIKTDRLSLALSLANSGQWRRSLVELDKVRGDSKSVNQELSPEFKSFLYLTYIWVLGQIQEVQPDGSWIGEVEWKQLNDDPEFIREFITGNSWEHDGDLNNGLGFCSLKFAVSDRSLQSARNYFQRSHDDSNPEQRKAPSLFALAMIDLIEMKEDLAEEKLRKASELDPSGYQIEDRIIYKNSFINSTEFKIWEWVAQKVNGGDFNKLYNHFLDRLQSKSARSRR